MVVEFDYTLFARDETIDLSVTADVNTRSSVVRLLSVVTADDGAPFDADEDLRGCLVSDAVIVAEEKLSQEEWG
jgi:hypothetical protein